MGRYQMGWPALIDAGFCTSANNWTSLAKEHGVTSKESFLKTRDAQEAAIRRFHKVLYRYLKSNGALNYVGKTMNSVFISESGILAAAHLIGAGGVNSTLKSGDLESKQDGFGTKPLEYIKLLGGYDISEIK